jgi:AcrR family transcriptional regulator
MPPGERKQSSNIARRRAAAREDSRSGYVDRRDEILKAAARVFKQRGFGGTTLNHIAAELGSDRASLYYYVASKDELFEEIVGDAVRDNLAMITAVRDGPGTAPEKLRRLIVGVMTAYADLYPVPYVLIQENPDHIGAGHGGWPPRIKQLTDQFLGTLTEIVAAGQEDGTLVASAPAWLFAQAIVGMLSWSNRWFDPATSPLTAAEVGAAFSDAILAGITV